VTIQRFVLFIRFLLDSSPAPAQGRSNNPNVHREFDIQSFASRRGQCMLPQSTALMATSMPRETMPSCYRRTSLFREQGSFAVTFSLPSLLSVCYRRRPIPPHTDSSQPRLPGGAVQWTSVQEPIPRSAA
jgi:hypothetical protein